MQLFDPNNPNERKKMIAAGVLGLAAIVVLGYVFFGGSSTKTTTPRPSAGGPAPSPARNQLADIAPDDPAIYQPINYTGAVPRVSEANRNIFAYYEPPARPIRMPSVPTPTPTPIPPVLLSSLAPANVYARTPADFSLQITGDKFTPALHVIIDGRDLPARFINAQQLFTTVPSALITNPGPRQVMLRSNDGKLYSNTFTLNVTPPPVPNYNFIGMIGKPGANDTAVLQDKGSKDVMNVQRGDLLSGRFRVSSISEKEVVLIDATLKIRHTIAFSTDPATGSQFRPPVRVSDEEPL